MLILVREVIEGAAPVIVCDTAAGPLTARWRGDLSPDVGTAQDVELDTGGALTWGHGLTIVSPDGTSEHGQSLSAQIEHIEGDSVSVRVGDAVLLLDVDGSPPHGAVGEPVRLAPAFFEVWPTGV